MKTCQWTEYECPHYCEGQTNYCASHNFEMRRRSVAIQRNSLKKRPAKIQQVSEKRKEVLKEYKPMKAEYLSTHQYCEARLLGCTGLANQLHHLKMSAKFHNDPDSVIAVCFACHHQIETVLSAKQRREMGFLV